MIAVRQECKHLGMYLSLPEQSDLGAVLVRTDYGDDLRWRDALAAATAEHPQPGSEPFVAQLVPFEHPDLHRLTVAQLAELPVSGYLAYVFVADAQTMIDQTFVVVDLAPDSPQRGQSLRCTAEAVQEIENNLSVANMDFAEFAAATDPDGVFRDF